MDNIQDLVQIYCERSYIQNTELIPLFELESLRSSAEIMAHIDMRKKALVLQLVAELPALLKERVVIKERWPKDWWEAVKERWAPRWFLRRWPVLYAGVSVDRPIYAAVCPHLPVTPHGTHIKWMAHQQRDVE